MSINLYTAIIGIGSVVFLFLIKSSLKNFLLRIGLSPRISDLLAKAGPVAALIITTVVVGGLGLDNSGVKIVGEVPKGLPSVALPPVDFNLWIKLIVPALLISIVGYVESISVALTFAAKKRQRVDPDQELIALGASNIGAGISGGFPVTGGLSRTVVNYDAGAETPAAGIFTAVGIGLTTLFLTPLLFFLPKATLGAVIIVAVISLVDIKALMHTFNYSKADFAAMLTTIIVTWLAGIEAGLVLGVALSISLHLYSSSRPHIAIVGQVPGTAHFRNVKRHNVVTYHEILSMRVDESLYFPNARFIEDRINAEVAANSEIKHVILECPAVNAIDISALESLEAINLRLKDGGITFHLSEVKGPIMDRLKKSHFLEELTGKVHLTHYDAVSSINPELTKKTLEEKFTNGN